MKTTDRVFSRVGLVSLQVTVKSQGLIEKETCIQRERHEPQFSLDSLLFLNTILAFDSCNSLIQEYETIASLDVVYGPFAFALVGPD